jgi:hypothetical protein
VEIVEGEGWRLGHDPSRSPFPVLMGGSGWAAEFTAGEARVLRRGVLRLVEQFESLREGLMAEEAITLEVSLPLEPESSPGDGDVWVALEGDRERWTLRFVLTPPRTRRGVEGSWDVCSTAALVAVLRQSDAWGG